MAYDQALSPMIVPASPVVLTLEQAGLPVEIAFLLEHGVSLSVLQEAATLARCWDVPAHDAVLALGIVGEKAFYRALAATVGLPFLDARARADARIRYPGSVQSGVLPLEKRCSGPRYALAPTGAQVRRLLDRRGKIPAGDAAITTPRHLTHLALTARGDDIAYTAANALADARPADSIRGGLSLAQILVVSAALSVLVLSTIAAPFTVAAGLALLASVVFFSLVALRLLAARQKIPVSSLLLQSSRMLEADLPVYSVIVALHRERAVLPQLVEALGRFDYPPAKLDIKLVIEADDRETADALAALTLPPFMEVLVAPPGEPRTKPRALNVALSLARGSFVVVFDAEDVPDPAQLRLAIAAFACAAPNVACFQARLVIDNTEDGWLTRFFTLEYLTLFDVVKPALARFGLPIPLGGTSNHFRTDVLREIGGWDAWNVTEDADLGFRLATHGWRVGDLPSATMEEAPAELGAWLAQRTRWMKGWMQVCIVHSRHPVRTARALGPSGFLSAVALSLGSVLTALGFPFFTGYALGLLLSGVWLAPETSLDGVVAALSLILFVAGGPAMVWPAISGARRRQLSGLIPLAFLLPFYYILVSAAAWRALVELVYAPFRWNKTEHGLARTSRLKNLSAPEHSSPNLHPSRLSSPNLSSPNLSSPSPSFLGPDPLLMKATSDPDHVARTM